jgi:predicted butyrate kinase (DUF1464 family)
MSILTPWRVNKHIDEDTANIINNKEVSIALVNNKENAEYIIKCVNERKELINAIDALIEISESGIKLQPELKEIYWKLLTKVKGE